MTPAQIIPIIVVPLFAWRIYTRFRRTIGRQAFRPHRLITSIVIFSLISAAIAVFTFNYLPSLTGLGCGLLLGLPLALAGLHLTRFETTPEGMFYIPNPIIGIAVAAIFVGRIAYRFVVLMAAAPPGGEPPPDLFKSPLTLVLYGLTAGYYIAYFAGVLRRGRKLA